MKIRFAPLTPDDVRAGGETLYGERWKKALAHELFAYEAELGCKVDERRVFGWARGEYNIPPALGDIMDRLAVKRLESLRDWRNHIRERTKE